MTDVAPETVAAVQVPVIKGLRHAAPSFVHRLYDKDAQRRGQIIKQREAELHKTPRVPASQTPRVPASKTPRDAAPKPQAKTVRIEAGSSPAAAPRKAPVGTPRLSTAVVERLLAHGAEYTLRRKELVKKHGTTYTPKKTVRMEAGSSPPAAAAAAAPRIALTGTPRLSTAVVERLLARGQEYDHHRLELVKQQAAEHAKEFSFTPPRSGLARLRSDRRMSQIRSQEEASPAGSSPGMTPLAFDAKSPDDAAATPKRPFLHKKKNLAQALETATPPRKISAGAPAARRGPTPVKIPVVDAAAALAALPPLDAAPQEGAAPIPAADREAPGDAAADPSGLALAALPDLEAAAIAADAADAAAAAAAVASLPMAAEGGPEPYAEPHTPNGAAAFDDAASVAKSDLAPNIAPEDPPAPAAAGESDHHGEAQAAESEDAAFIRALFDPAPRAPAGSLAAAESLSGEAPASGTEDPAGEPPAPEDEAEARCRADTPAPADGGAPAHTAAAAAPMSPEGESQSAV